MLIFLGVIFLISLIKDIFKTNHEGINIVPINTKDSLLSTEDQSELIGKGKELLSEMEEDQQVKILDSNVKKVVFSKLIEI